jgi:hypothetical protein
MGSVTRRMGVNKQWTAQSVAMPTASESSQPGGRQEVEAGVVIRDPLYRAKVPMSLRFSQG